MIVRPRPRVRRRLAAQTWEQVALPALARRARAALVFSPANLAPLAWPRNVLVMHDAAVLREPDAYSRAYVLWHRRFGLAAARRALAVITVSEFSRRELVSLAGLDPARVHVVPGGVSERFHPGVDHERVTSKLGLRRPYVLTIATADRRKNLASLAVAAARLAEEGIDLVWAGDDRPYFSASGSIPGSAVAGLCRRRRPPGPVRGRAGVRAPVALRGLRPDLPGGDGVRGPGRGSRPGGPARDLRRRRPAGRSRRSRSDRGCPVSAVGDESVRRRLGADGIREPVSSAGPGLQANPTRF